jgi:DNA-binding transcriptional regulator YiaG
LNGNMIFAKRIKQLREENGDSQESLSVIFNYSKQAISNWEVSGKVPRSKY